MSKKIFFPAILTLILFLFVGCNTQSAKAIEEKNVENNFSTLESEKRIIEPGAEINIENKYLLPKNPELDGETKIQSQLQPFINAFMEKYPDAYIVKYRWEDVRLGENYTYIIEGVEGNNKYIVKYLGEPLSVLGLVERELNELEVDENNKPTERELKIQQLISLDYIYELSQEDGRGMRTIQWIISCNGEYPILEILNIDGKNRTSVRAANAATGEILK